MKKTLITSVLTACVLSGNTMAGEWFVGAELGKVRQDYSVSGSYDSMDIQERGKENNTHQGIRVGRYITDNIRIYGTVSRSKGDTDVDFDFFDKYEHSNYQVLVSSDYLFGSGSIRPFVGLSIGTNKFKVKINGQSRSDTATAYGAQAGVNWQVAQNWSVESGIQVLKHSNSFKASDEFWAISSKAKNNKTEKAYLSVQYYF